MSPQAPPHTGYDFVKTIHHDIYPSIDATKTDLSQPGKVVLITGSGRGIGAAIALEYAKAGVAHLVLAARTTSQLTSVGDAIKAINPQIKVTLLPLDVSNKSQVSDAAQKVKNEIGRLDVLINNAGRSENWVPITESDPDDYWQSWEVMVNGTYLMLRNFLPLLVGTAEKEKTVVDILNIVSIGAHVRLPGASSYQSAKLALCRLSEFVNVEYGAKGVNCIALNPGGVVTEMSKDIAILRDNGLLPDTAELCGGAAVWLTKGKQTWLAGRYVSVNWDVNELLEKKEEIVSHDLLKVHLAT